MQLAQHAARPTQAHAALVRPPKAARAPLLIALAVLAVLPVGAVFVLTASGRQSVPAPPAPPVVHTATPPVTPAAAPKAKVPSEVSYPLHALSSVNALVDIDASRAHLLGLFPTVTSEQRAGELSYRLPLSHPWFSAAEFNWKNEKDGKLVSVAFRPPTADQNFKNQKEIADCLTKGLGKPEVRELNHLAGELSYFWGPHFPNAWADLYSSYLWLAFEDPKGVAPVTFANVVRTLDGCAAHAP